MAGRTYLILHGARYRRHPDAYPTPTSVSMLYTDVTSNLDRHILSHSSESLKVFGKRTKLSHQIPVHGRYFTSMFTMREGGRAQELNRHSFVSSLSPIDCGRQKPTPPPGDQRESWKHHSQTTALPPPAKSLTPYRGSVEGPLIINAVLLSLPANKTKDAREEIIYTSRRIQLPKTIPGLMIYLEEGK